MARLDDGTKVRPFWVLLRVAFIVCVVFACERLRHDTDRISASWPWRIRWILSNAAWLQ